MTNNFHDNPQAAQFIDRQPVHDAAPDAGDVGSSGFWYAESQPWPWYIENMTPLGTSNDVTENLRSFVANGPGQGGGKLFRGFYDPATLTVTPDEDWGADHGAVNGFIDYNELQPVRKYTCITNPEKTKIYTTSGMDGTVGTIVVWDVETGERLDTWDVSDILPLRQQRQRPGGRTGVREPVLQRGSGSFRPDHLLAPHLDHPAPGTGTPAR